MEKKSWKDRLIFPPQPMGSKFIVEISGGESVMVEFHFGIREYTSELVRINVRQGSVRICGENLRISRMTGRTVEVRGRIRAVELE